MAHIVNCRFCHGHSINHDHDGCAERFGKMIEGKILTFCIRNPHKPLPKEIVGLMGGVKWKAYGEYLERVKKHNETIRKLKKYAKIFETRLQKIANNGIQRMDPEFQISVVKVVCTPVPRF